MKKLLIYMIAAVLGLSCVPDAQLECGGQSLIAANAIHVQSSISYMPAEKNGMMLTENIRMFGFPSHYNA